jgi:hypothetical protein
MTVRMKSLVELGKLAKNTTKGRLGEVDEIKTANITRVTFQILYPHDTRDVNAAAVANRLQTK